MLGASSSFLSAFLSRSRTLHLSIRSCTAVGYFLLSSAFTLDRFLDAAQRTEPPDFSLLSMRGTDDPSAQKNQSQQHEPHRRTRSLSRTLKQRGASDSRHTGAAVSGESLRSFYWAGRRVCERWRAGCLWNWMLEGFLHAALHGARARPVHDVSWGDQRVVYTDLNRTGSGLQMLDDLSNPRARVWSVFSPRIAHCCKFECGLIEIWCVCVCVCVCVYVCGVWCCFYISAESTHSLNAH